MSNGSEIVTTGSRPQRTDSDIRVDESATRRLWLYTNRLNILEILSSRLIKPPSGYVKYYRDASSLTPGVLPLFESSPSLTLINGAFDSDVGSRPPPGVGAVVLQFSASDLAISHIAEGSQARVVTFVSDVLPLRLVEAIHFPDSDQLEEHRARTFSGVTRRGPPLVSSPHLFQPESGAVTPDGLQELFRMSQFHGRETAPLHRYLQLDSLGGGFIMAFGGGEAELERDVILKVESVEGGIEFLAHHLLGPNSTSATDHRFLTTIVETISRLERQVDSASAVVEAIRQATATHLDVPAIGVAEEYLRGIDMVIDGERMVRPFSPGGLASGKALLLFLLDPVISAVDKLEHHRLGPDATTVAVTRALIGLRTGRSRIPEAYRPEWLEEMVVGLECSVLNSINAKATAGRTQRSVSAPALTTTDVAMLREKFRDDVPKSARTRAEARRIVTLMGWDDCASTTVYGAMTSAGSRSNGVKFSGIPRVVTRINYARLRDRLLDHSVQPAEVSHLFPDQAKG